MPKATARLSPRRFDRELARIGPPVSDAQPLGRPYTLAGSVTGIDHPLIRAQSYTASGLLGGLAGQAAASLAGHGYQLREGSLAARYKGGQEGPPFTLGYVLSWHVQGHQQSLDASVEFRFRSDAPLVPVSADHPWLTYLAAEPVPPLELTPDNGLVIVTVQRGRAPGAEDLTAAADVTIRGMRGQSSGDDTRPGTGNGPW